MGRKRSIGQEVLMREARRKKQEAVKRLTEWHYCPVCKTKTVETDWVLGKNHQRIREKTLVDGGSGKVEVSATLYASLCHHCKRKKVMWLLPWEDPIDLYHLFHDELRGEVMWIELFEWLFSEWKESKDDIARRKRVEEEKNSEKWRREVVVIGGVKVSKTPEPIPEPRLTE